MTKRYLYVAGLASLTACRIGTSTDAVSIRVDAANATSLPVLRAPVPRAPFTIIVTNGSARTVTVLATMCPGFEVLDANARVVGPRTTIVCAAVAMAPLRVEPGASVTIARHWEGSARNETAELHALPPGHYVLRTTIAIDGKLRHETTPVDILP